MSEWRPIDSAPMDGSFVLVYARDDQCYEPGDQTQWVAQFGDGRWWYEDNEYAVDPQPTHWQPLQEPPDGPPKS
jgi:hypothetical protein